MENREDLGVDDSTYPRDERLPSDPSYNRRSSLLLKNEISHVLSSLNECRFIMNIRSFLLISFLIHIEIRHRRVFVVVKFGLLVHP